MRTPSGIECRFFYGDYHRGRQHEECRLLGNLWRPALCASCPVPKIDRSNSCESMHIRAKVVRPISALFKPRVEVSAYCEKTQQVGFDPHIGCGACHPLPGEFKTSK